MDYNTAIEVLKRRALEKNIPTSGFVSISPKDIDPTPDPLEMINFCRWLNDQGYTRSFPSQGPEGEWFIHPSPLALYEWDISEHDA